MEIAVPPVLNQRNEDLAFEWQVISFTEHFFEIKLDFEKPHLISMEEEPNIMHIHFWDTTLFARSSDYVQISRDSKLKVELSTQLTTTEKE